MLTDRWYKLRPHEGQRALWHSKARFIVLPCGRRCLESGTLVATPYGPRPIESLKVGDQVIGFEDGRAMITTVEAVWDNGKQLVYPMGSKLRTYLAGTAQHKLWAAHESKMQEKDYGRMEISRLARWYRVRRVYVEDLIQGGPVHQEKTYSLGAMLGNGCCRSGKTTEGKRSRHLYISSPDGTVPERMAQELGCAFENTTGNNFTWKLTNAFGSIPYFMEWCFMKYSHEKTADWSVIDTWDKESCLAFLAGVIDTDGCIRFKETDKRQIVIQVAMQAKTVVEACRNIVFKYFQEYRELLLDDRERYKNGPLHILSITDNLLVCRLICALRPYMTKDIDIEGCQPHNILPDRISLQNVGDPYLAQTHDITVANASNLYVLHNGGIVTSNSGKSEIAKRKLVLAALNPDTGYSDPNYFVAAPTHAQAKRIYWKDLKDLIPTEFIENIREGELSISLKNGATIYCVGMDKPARIEGISWNGGILDEYANMKPQAWQENVRPALSDRNGWCWLIGVPEGRNHYYELYLQALEDKTGEWAVFQWPSADILDPVEVESARRMLDPLTFDQEYNASFVSFSGKAYYNFDVGLHVSKSLAYNDYAPLVFCFDFNVSPGVAVVLQEQVLPGCFAKVPNPRMFRGSDAMRQALQSDSPDAFIRSPVTGTGIIGEVHIPQNSTTPSVCRRLIKDWGDHKGEIYCYGDASGGAKGTAKTQGSDWDIINRYMTNQFGDRVSIVLPKANPPERARLNAMNSRLKSADGTVSMLIDASCRNMIRDLDGVRVLEGGTGEVDKKRDPKLTHMCFAAETRVNGAGISSMPCSGKVRTVFGLQEFVNPGKRGKSLLVELAFSDGTKLRCTPDHQIFTFSGWIEAIRSRWQYGIFVPDGVCAEPVRGRIDRWAVWDAQFRFSTKLIVDVRLLDGLHDVWCPKVKSGHFCLDNGLIVSNSDALGYYVSYEFPMQTDDELLPYPVENIY